MSLVDNRSPGDPAAHDGGVTWTGSLSVGCPVRDPSVRVCWDLGV